MKTVRKETKLLYAASGLALLASLTSGNPTFLLAATIFLATGYSFSR